ncbi:hypothetical protein WN51_01272 [Melipona quadrifasciata]|uniref:Uncharacterized protein n=1 Tax=Melipona quadrifasciata TaxID=166423 RepID=A0A0M8ZX47_9HYME|nr:hypothetical protein WN51_01272 [Melipona quadrifasciata]
MKNNILNLASVISILYNKHLQVKIQFFIIVAYKIIRRTMIHLRSTNTNSSRLHERTASSGSLKCVILLSVVKRVFDKTRPTQRSYLGNQYLPNSLYRSLPWFDNSKVVATFVITVVVAISYHDWLVANDVNMLLYSHLLISRHSKSVDPERDPPRFRQQAKDFQAAAASIVSRRIENHAAGSVIDRYSVNKNCSIFSHSTLSGLEDARDIRKNSFTESARVFPWAISIHPSSYVLLYEQQKCPDPYNFNETFSFSREMFQERSSGTKYQKRKETNLAERQRNFAVVHCLYTRRLREESYKRKNAKVDGVLKVECIGSEQLPSGPFSETNRTGIQVVQFF